MLRTITWLIILAAIGLAYAQEKRQTPTTPTQEPSRYEVITTGLLGNANFPIQFKSADLRLEFRDLMMGAGEARAVPIPTRTLMEVRGGGVVVTINGEKRERRPGEFWMVEPGSSLSFENHGEVAVIRAIYVFEGRK